jgi:hypothetical protein
MALTLRLVINKYYQNYKLDLKDNELTLKDWRQLCIIKEFLKPFYNTTLYTKEDCVIINQVFFTINILIKHF